MPVRNYTVITGASQGFGKSLAIECASRQMNLVLVALPGADLYFLSDFIRRNYAVDVISVEKDLSSEEECVALFEFISSSSLSVNMLINNAGIGSTMPFEEGSIYFYQQQIKVNVLATTLITRLFLGLMRKHKCSYILNVGSLSSFFFLPGKEVYSGTKAFIYSFTKSLRREVRSSGIKVSLVCPGGMNTNLSLTLFNKRGSYLSRLSIMNPEDVAPLAIEGLLQGKEIIIPGKVNRMFLFLNNILPARIKNRLARFGMKKMKTFTPAAAISQSIVCSAFQPGITLQEAISQLYSHLRLVGRANV